ncbi:alginate export family protein [Pseudomonas neustonica]|uniref:ion channel protein AlgE n=1 Tax=Pseudomonas neustonica TaxID=2487346 RepID=UPI000C980937|nr:ion channel protein AlgE [Pseudomonadales bacterium]|tara:strand:- start:9301 stop:10671 length:1371 start_codon:yes stop_codon:yes gene_type:complete
MKGITIAGACGCAFCLPCLSVADEEVGAANLPFAEEIVTYEVRNKFTLQTGYGPEDSLLGADRETFYSLRYEPTFIWYSPDQRWPRWEVFTRGWLAYDSSSNATGFNNDDQQNVEGLNAELREFYVRRNLLGDDPRFSLAVGRQRYAGKYGLWWDDTFESVRFDYVDSFSRGFLAYGQKFYNYNTEVNELDPRDEKLHNALGEYAWNWRENQWAGVRFTYQKDHSDVDLDDGSDFTGWRYGGFASAEHLDMLLLSDYHVELAALHGKRDNVASSGISETNMRGWALLTEFGRRFYDVAWQPRIVIRSGLTDKPGDDDDGFYLSRIQSDRLINDASYSTRLVSSFMRMDIRNLLYYGIGVDAQPTARSSVDMRVSDLRLRNSDAALPVRTTEAQDSSSHSLGQVVDVNFYWQSFPLAYAGRQFDMNTLVSAGYFFAGPATGNLDDDFQLTLSVVMRY